MGPGADRYDHGVRPVFLREGCPLPEAPVTITGLQVRVFPLDGSSPTVEGTLEADFTIDPALPPAE